MTHGEKMAEPCATVPPTVWMPLLARHVVHVHEALRPLPLANGVERRVRTLRLL